MKVLRTREFADWLNALRDKRGKVKILERLDRMEEGNPGKTRSVGSRVMELKIDFGPGYRLYFVRRGAMLAILLCGGDKSFQD